MNKQIREVNVNTEDGKVVLLVGTNDVKKISVKGKQQYVEAEMGNGDTVRYVGYPYAVFK